MKSIC